MTDVTAGGSRPSTTDVKTLRCDQCVTCTSGPSPELREHTSPDGVMVRLPACFAGSVYIRSGFAVCRNVTRWDR